MLDSIPDDAIEDYRTNEKFSWIEKQSVILPDGTHELRTIMMEAILRNSTWYFTILHPFTLKSRYDGLPENTFEAKEWIPQVFDIAKNNWRKATQWECGHWNDLVNCPSCKHPTIPQFECNVCGDNLTPNLQETEKRVLSLICIIPDSTDFILASGEEEGENEPEPQEEEASELEEVIEEEVSEEVKEREEDEET